MENRIIERGDIFHVGLRGSGRELSGPHYAVVVSDDPYNWLSTVVIVPFSSSARPASFRIETSLRDSKTRALVDQVRTIDKRRLGEWVGNLSGTTEMALIDEQLRVFLALDLP